MDPCLEVDPSRLVIVVGPAFTANVYRDLDSGAECCKLPTFAYSSAVEEGVTMILDTEAGRTDAERSKHEMLYRNAYELDPIFALRKVSEKLKKHGRYDEWLNRLFARELPSAEAPKNLQHLLELQSAGALLVYTHCDDTLSRALNTQPFLLEQPRHAERWSNGEMGFLHVHGVYTDPITVKLDCDLYERNSSSNNSSIIILHKVFEERCAVLLGFDSYTSDPLQAKFFEGFIGKSTSRRHVFTLGENIVPLGLPMPSCDASLGKMVCTMTESSVSLCK